MKTPQETFQEIIRPQLDAIGKEYFLKGNGKSILGKDITLNFINLLPGEKAISDVKFNHQLIFYITFSDKVKVEQLVGKHIGKLRAKTSDSEGIAKYLVAFLKTL